METAVMGEFVVSARGVEGGGVYAVSADVRDGAPLMVDLLPDLSVEEVAARLATRPKKRTLSQHLEKALKLDPVKRALFAGVRAAFARGSRIGEADQGVEDQPPRAATDG